MKYVYCRRKQEAAKRKERQYGGTDTKTVSHNESMEG